MSFLFLFYYSFVVVVVVLCVLFIYLLFVMSVVTKIKTDPVIIFAVCFHPSVQRLVNIDTTQ